MSKPAFLPLADLTGTGQTAAVEIAHLEEAAIVVGGTFVGTFELEVSPDGTMWVPHATITGKTAPFAGEIGYRCKQVRLSCTAHTSGTIESFVAGSDTDLEG